MGELVGDSLNQPPMSHCEPIRGPLFLDLDLSFALGCALPATLLHLQGATGSQLTKKLLMAVLNTLHRHMG